MMGIVGKKTKNKNAIIIVYTSHLIIFQYLHMPKYFNPFCHIDFPTTTILNALMKNIFEPFIGTVI